MPGQSRTSILGGMLAIACLLGGCNLPPQGQRPPGPRDSASVPPHVVGTVAEYAMLTGGSDLPVRGYGIVAGLGKNGSREVPANVRDYLTQVLLKAKELTGDSGGNVVSPRTILEDLGTSVVSLEGRIPPGAPVGTPFDVLVSTPPEVQTRSLDGGVTFLPAELFLAVPGELAGRQSHLYATADGTIFINPFLDPTRSDDLPRLREGRIIGGGRVAEARPLRLYLFRPDYHQADLIQRRLNERFGPDRVAAAKDSATIEVTIPREFTGDYERFLRLLMHVPIRQTAGAWEAKAREIASAMETSGANHDELALVWEAIGRQVLPVVQPLYESANPAVSLYAARTGLRFGDIRAVPVVVAVAADKASPFRLAAIDELGRQPLSAKITPALRLLLDDQNESVRLAACDAIIRQGDQTRVTRTTLKDQFEMDRVASAAEPMIYVSQSLRQRIVLFGNDLTVRCPMFFTAPEDLVTISAQEGANKLTVFRKIPATGRSSQTFTIEPSVVELIRLLGTLPARQPGQEVYGLGLTYSQVAGVLHRLCKAGDIPAGFRLQVLPEVSKIYTEGAESVGRPDMPGS